MYVVVVVDHTTNIDQHKPHITHNHTTTQPHSSPSPSHPSLPNQFLANITSISLPLTTSHYLPPPYHPLPPQIKLSVQLRGSLFIHTHPIHIHTPHGPSLVLFVLFVPPPHQHHPSPPPSTKLPTVPLHPPLPPIPHHTSHLNPSTTNHYLLYPTYPPSLLLLPSSLYIIFFNRPIFCDEYLPVSFFNLNLLSYRLSFQLFVRITKYNTNTPRFRSRLDRQLVPLMFVQNLPPFACAMT